MNKQKNAAPARKNAGRPSPPGQGTSRTAQKRRRAQARNAIPAVPSSSSSNAGRQLSVRQQAQRTLGRGILSEAAAKYIRCLVDPQNADPVGIPVPPVLYTDPQRVFVRGTFTTNANGFGFVVLSPQAACVNNNFCIECQNPAVPGTTITTNSTNTNYSSNSPYAAANIGAGKGVQYRAVAAELAVLNRTELLDRGGDLAGISAKAHQNLNASTFSDILSYDEGEEVAHSKDQWNRVIYIPATPSDYAFQTTVTSITADPEGGFMAFAVQCNPLKPQTFHFEAYVVIEFMGVPVRHKKISPADQNGADAAHTTATLALTKPHQRHPDLANRAHAATEAVARRHMSVPGKEEAHSDLETDVKKVFETGKSAIDLGSSLASGIGAILSLL